MYLDLIDPLSSKSMSCHDRIMTNPNNVKACYHDHIIVDKQMKRKKRQILLIMDNVPTHIIPDNLRHIKVHFLPPTTTSHLQPLDAGIIQSFKSHFRRQQLKLIIDQLDTVGRHRVEFSDAIRFTKRAWDAVTPDTIKHCWQHTKLVPRDALTTDSVTDSTTDSVTDATTDSVTEATTDSVTDNDDDDTPLAELLRRATAALNIDSDVTMTADEFVTVDKDVELFSDMSDEAIMDIVKGTENNPECSDEDPEPEPPHPKTTLSDARSALGVLLHFIEDQGEEDDIKNLSQNSEYGQMFLKWNNFSQPRIKLG